MRGRTWPTSATQPITQQQQATQHEVQEPEVPQAGQELQQAQPDKTEAGILLLAKRPIRVPLIGLFV